MQKQHFLSVLSGEMRAQQLSILKLLFLMLAILICAALDASAQIKKPNKKTNAAVAARRLPADSIGKIESESIAATKPIEPVSLVNSVESDYLSGEASVAVNPKQPTIVRLGLAQNAVSIVEFPASDGIYYIHEGNPKLVSIFQSPTKETDRSITIYPGEGFVVSRDSAVPSAAITLQMRSGLILILEFVPVSNIRKNAHRCVINYNRDEIIAARRVAGLAYDLGGEEKPTIQKITKATSKLVSANIPETIEERPEEPELQPIRLETLIVNRGKVSRKPEDSPAKNPKTGIELSRFVNKKLADCLKGPGKTLGTFSKPTNGLSLAVSAATELDSEQRLVIVGIKSSAISNLRLIPGTPELQIQTLDEKGNALQTERIERKYVETTSFEGLIQPGSIVFYAIVYNAPVMSKSQRLVVLASHREAADQPISTVLPSVNEAKE